jgi:hypothetical protein
MAKYIRIHPYSIFMRPRAPALSASDLLLIENAGIYQASFTYSGNNQRSSIPPYADNLVLSGTMTVGQIIGISFDFISPSGLSQGNTIITFYSTTNLTGGTLTAIQTGLLNTYTLTANESGKYIIVKVNVKDSLGTSALIPSWSYYSSTTVVGAFNPLTDIAWYVACGPDQMHHTGDGTAVTAWDNQGSKGGDIQPINSPTWNAASGSSRCASASSQHFNWKGFAATQTFYEMMVIMKVETNVFGQVFNSTSGIAVTYDNSPTGSVNVPGTTGLIPGGGSPYTGYWPLQKWVLVNYVWRNTATGNQELRFNNQTVGVSCAGSGTTGTAAGRIFAASNGSSNFVNGWVKYLFITPKDVLLTAPERANMLQWALDNALYDDTI